jgi:transmembrane sensor
MDLKHEQLKELAFKYLNGEATEREERLLHEWYDTVNAGELEIVLSQLPTDVASFREGAWKEMQARIAARQQAMDPTVAASAAEYLPGSGRKLFSWRKAGIAACFILLAGLTVRWYHRRPAPAKDVAPAVAKAKPERTDAAPGSNRAILTLDDGKAIVLDSADKGPLAMQGNMQILKLDDGRIAYRKDGSPASGEDQGGTEKIADVKTVSYNVMSTPRGGQYQLTLPDGTKVWLNAASSIRYPTAFNGRERRVEVRGEAYFEVAANAARPFFVDVSKQQTIEVLGTHFNVNAYEDEINLSTTLLEGSVRVRGEKADQSLVLQPGQQLRLGRKGGQVVTDHANIEAVMGWKNGIFSFDRSDIQSVMRELARWYDMEVEFRGTPTTDLFGGDIRRNLPLSKVFRILEKSQVHFKIEHGKIIVTP